ncbi:acyl-CoA dehydrogenase/oxidase [Hyaloraphidium curvatum]|nr:acyl-CoA dehydrogenase/oxidase [Hyaloraphidium curvatum]
MTHGEKGVVHESGVVLSPYAAETLQKIKDFVENDCIPAEPIYREQLEKLGRWNGVPAVMEQLKKKARSLGLWNLFLTEEYGPLSPGLTTMEYAVVCEVLGRSGIASYATNCSAPDTGNMEVLAKFGTEEQRKKWLVPLMEGQIRSAFAMTEPDVASSDAANISCSITKSADGKHYFINGRKHWISNSSHPLNKLYILVGKSNPNGERYTSQSVVLIPKFQEDGTPTPGITIVRHMHVFGYDDAPAGHDEMIFENVKVPAENLVLGEGRGFEVLQGRLGGGRIHHCMRTLGVAERAMELFLMEATNTKKRPFGKLKGEQGKIQWEIAKSRIELEMCRRLVYNAALAMDRRGYKGAIKEIAMAKIAIPHMVCDIIDRAIQCHGGLGISQSTELANMYAHIRHLRFADGPDEAHAQQLARAELKKADEIRKKHEQYRRLESELRGRL